MAQQQGGNSVAGEGLLAAALIGLALLAIAIVGHILWQGMADNGDAPQPPYVPTPIATVGALPPTVTVLLSSYETPTPEPPERLPVQGTRVPPSATPTPTPTVTPLPTTAPVRAPTQRG